MYKQITAMLLGMGMAIFPTNSATSEPYANIKTPHGPYEESDLKTQEARRKIDRMSKFMEIQIYQAWHRIEKQVFLTDQDRKNYIEMETQVVLAEIERHYGIKNIELLIPDVETYLQSWAIVLGNPCEKNKSTYKEAWGYVVGKTAWVVATVYFPAYSSFADIVGTGIGKFVGGLIYEEHCSQ